MARLVRLLHSAALALAACATLPGCFPLAVTGAAVGTMAVIDRRSVGTQVDDQSIQLRGTQRLKEALPGSEQAYAYVTSFNRRVLLTGLAPDEKSRERAGEIAKGLPGITTVHNEINVRRGGPPPSAAVDTTTTARVKTALASEKNFDSSAIKVVTEQNVVYLMGLVTDRERRVAAEVARRVGGVERVVTLFDSITEAELAELHKSHGDKGAAAPPKN